MAEFGRLVTTGAIPPRDRFGHPIERGHFVLYRPDVDVAYEVVDIVPVLNPQMPGMVKVVLKTTVPLTIPANRPVMTLVICGQTPEKGLTDPAAVAARDAAMPAALEDGTEADPGDQPGDPGPEPTADEGAARLEQARLAGDEGVSDHGTPDDPDQP